MTQGEKDRKSNFDFRKGARETLSVLIPPTPEVYLAVDIIKESMNFSKPSH